MALLLVRVAENEAGRTWLRMREVLQQMHVADLVTPEGRVTQRTETTPEQKNLFTALGLPEPPRFLEMKTTRKGES